MFGVTDPGELEELRGLETAGGDNDFFGSVYSDFFPVSEKRDGRCGNCSVRVWLEIYLK